MESRREQGGLLHRGRPRALRNPASLRSDGTASQLNWKPGDIEKTNGCVAFDAHERRLRSHFGNNIDTKSRNCQFGPPVGDAK